MKETKVALIFDGETVDDFTGETNETKTYIIDGKFGNFEVTTISTSINGVCTVEGNGEMLEVIYKHFDEEGNTELYLDSMGQGAFYLDITTWDSPSTLEEIKNTVINLLK